MYVPETNFVQPQSFLEALENFYVVFADTLQQMQHNTTCTCRACKNMGMLDLKMCIHYGEYLIQKLGNREELLGADVIVPHRMLKNEVIEKTGINSYALFSDVAAQKLDLLEYCEKVVPHSETLSISAKFQCVSMTFGPCGRDTKPRTDIISMRRKHGSCAKWRSRFPRC
jgi:hypothetical protein